MAKPAEKDHNDEWQRLCQQMLGNHARDNKVNFNNIISDALMAEAEELEIQSEETSGKPDFPKLLNSFAQLLTGRFPDSMTKANAKMSLKLLEHLNSMVASFDEQNTLSSLASGRWLDDTIESRHDRLEQALNGLEIVDGTIKRCPTIRDLERNRNVEALCLELPKIKRITDVLNPLCINESLVSTLMSKLV